MAFSAGYTMLTCGICAAADGHKIHIKVAWRLESVGCSASYAYGEELREVGLRLWAL